MANLLLILLLPFVLISCGKEDDMPDAEIQEEEMQEIEETPVEGFELLSALPGHWVGSNETAFGNYDWFAFDFRPISPSHVHSIYEGGTNSNIITSVFIADHEGRKQVMARNGGWLGSQYRATYFVLDKAEIEDNLEYYRLVDAVGGENRAYIEFRFQNGEMQFDAYKDNSGSLDEPIHHMGFIGTNRNPSFAEDAIELHSFPQEVSEVNLNGAFDQLIDPDSALFLEEGLDPFPRSEHAYLSELIINIDRNSAATEQPLLLYLSKGSIYSNTNGVNFDNLENKLIRTVSIGANEDVYTCTYLHPDVYNITLFADLDGNQYPSEGDISSSSFGFSVQAESNVTSTIPVNQIIP